MGGAALLPPLGSHCIDGETRFDLACQYRGFDGSAGGWPVMFLCYLDCET